MKYIKGILQFDLI